MNKQMPEQKTHTQFEWCLQVFDFFQQTTFSSKRFVYDTFDMKIIYHITNV